MNKNRKWRVKYGFSSLDFEIIDEKDLEKAIYAQLKQIPIQLGKSFINGKNIISITPNYHSHTNWQPMYEPNSGEDFAQIKRDCPNYDGVIEAYKIKVAGLIQNHQENLIGKTLIEEKPQIENKPISEDVKKLADKFKI